MNRWEGLRTIFLDRDGVINRKAPEGEWVWRWQDFAVLAGVPEALDRLNHAGVQVFVVTNQRGVALGLYTEADIVALHARLSAWLAERDARIDGFYYCPHHRDSCRCRKPDTGLLEQAFADHGGNAASSVMIGDALSDIEAGRRLGMRTILIAGDQTAPTAARDQAAAMADAVCHSLVEAVKLLGF